MTRKGKRGGRGERSTTGVTGRDGEWRGESRGQERRRRPGPNLPKV